MVRSGAKGQAWIELNKDVCLGGRALEGARRGKENHQGCILGFLVKVAGGIVS